MSNLKLILILINLFNLINTFIGCNHLSDFDISSMINDPEYGKSWIFFPTGNGNIEKMFLTPDPNAVMRKDAYEDIRRSVKFELYTRENLNEPQTFRLRKKRAQAIEDLANIDRLFNPSLPSKFIIHGWKSDTDSDFIQNVKENYLKRMDCNVFAINWSKLASNTYYPTPAAQTKSVGICLADLLDHLVYYKHGNMSTFHLIGHSLGAHVAGCAGDSTQLGQVGRITGLDPAYPGFGAYTADDDSRLDSSDGEFVDVIHTCAGIAGISSAAGHVDFFPNGGSEQPGCTEGLSFDGTCRHSRAHQYYAESILANGGFYATKCKKNSKKNKACSQAIVMGDGTPRTARGNYYLETNSQAPFAMGPRN